VAQSKQKTLIQTLEKIGLGENEATLYALMLQHPKSSVQQLKVHAPFPRTMLYYVLDNLARLGLVSSVREAGRNVYLVESPDRLYDLMDARSREFAKDTEAVRTLVPELKKTYRLAGRRPSVRIFEGLEGYEKSLDDVLLSAEGTIFSYAPDPKVARAGVEIRKSYENKRLRRKKKEHMLLFDTPAAHQFLKERSYDDFTRFRFLPKDLAFFSTDVKLFSGKVLHTTYEEREPIAILTEDQRFFRMQEKIFFSFWEQGEEVTLLSK
jgi:sugar-specific transcriptional regulator TrmB